MSQALLFSLEKETFALPLASVNEVVRAAWPLRAPRAPFGCLGVLDIRGELVPLLDTAAMLGLRRAARADVLLRRLVESHVLLLTSNSGPFGLLVDQVVEVGEISDSLTEEDLSAANANPRTLNVVRGLAVAKGLRALLIDPNALVGERRARLLNRAIELAAGART
ncbi:MAG: chemotaxis protein CheW [Myxococcaceae bacterium]